MRQYYCLLTEDLGDHAEDGTMLLPQRVGMYPVGSQGELESSFLRTHGVVVLGTRIHPLETRTEINSSLEKKGLYLCRLRITPPGDMSRRHYCVVPELGLLKLRRERCLACTTAKQEIEMGEPLECNDYSQHR